MRVLLTGLRAVLILAAVPLWVAAGACGSGDGARSDRDASAATGGSGGSSGTGAGGTAGPPDGSMTAGDAVNTASSGGGRADSGAPKEASTPGSGGAVPIADSGMGGAGAVENLDAGHAGGKDAGSNTGGTKAPDATVDASSSCPATLPGPDLVQVPAPDGSAYCIDSTEVTNDQYAQFLAADPEMSGQEPICSWNSSYVPSFGWPPSTSGSHPVGFVDWCDAYAYCKWAGKRLCGRIGGGENATTDLADPTRSQWMNACSAGGAKPYPYGPAYDENACNGDDDSIPFAAPVATATACEGGYPGIFDLSGNLSEWEDSCSGTNGRLDACRLRGGSFGSSENDLACGDDYVVGRQVTAGSYGFRCCLDLP